MKQYYNHKGITIYHGDCKEIMPDLEPVDLIVTDPPYDIKVKGGKFFGAMKHFSAMENVTDMGCDYSFLDNYKDWICFCSLKQVATLLGFAGNVY
jgi:DNA modification methylase